MAEGSLAGVWETISGWLWAAFAAVMGIVWRLLRREQDKLETRMSQVEEAQRHVATKSDLESLMREVKDADQRNEARANSLRTFTSDKVAEVHRKVDESNRETNRHLLSILGSGRVVPPRGEK